MGNPTEAPKKCSRDRWCTSLKRLFTEANRKGINPVFVMSVSEETGRIAGVAYKKTERDRGLMLNFCPFCGESLKFWEVEGDESEGSRSAAEKAAS